MNLIIRSDQGDLLYGHQFLRRIIDTGPSDEIEVCEGIEPEVFFAYVGTKFPENRAVMTLLGNEAPDSDLLEAVSDSIKLTPQDVDNMRELQYWPRGDDELKPEDA
jgi:hypothetical protein